MSSHDYPGTLDCYMQAFDRPLTRRPVVLSVQTLLASEDATIVMWCSHQPPAERMLGWLGGFRPSHICTGLLHKLGSELQEPGRTRLETLRVSRVSTCCVRMRSGC